MMPLHRAPKLKAKAARLTIDSKGLSDIDRPIHGDHNLLVVGLTFTRLTVDSTAHTWFTRVPSSRRMTVVSMCRISSARVL
jgi:hypothetical protein